MKHLKTSLKLLVLLMAISFMVAGCQKEDDNITGHITGKNTGDVNAKLINLDELKQVQALRPHLNAIERTFDIHKAKTDAQSKIYATDGSFTILTDEILQVTTSYSEAYTFRIETPSHPETTFENFVIVKNGNQAYRFYIYSYVTLTINGNTDHYVFSTTEVDEDLINASNFQDLLNAKMQMIGNCLYEVDEVTGNAEPIWCFGSDGGSGENGDGGDGGDEGYNSCNNWTYASPWGNGTCLKRRSCIDAYGNIYIDGPYTVDCPPGMGNDYPDGSENGGDPNNGDIGDDAHWDDTDPIEQGGSGTGNTNNNPPPKGTLPFVPYDQQIIQCLGPQSDNDIATAIANWLDTASYLQIKNAATYLDNNECSEEAQEVFVEFLENVYLYPYPHCSSFEYSKPPGINIRACAVTNLTETFYAYGEQDGQLGTFVVTAHYSLVFFTMPTWMTNGQAATNTAIAVEKAFKTTKDWFYVNYDATEAEIQLYLDSSLIQQMGLFGGTKTDMPPFNIPSPAPYITSLFGTGNCN